MASLISDLDPEHTMEAYTAQKMTVSPRTEGERSSILPVELLLQLAPALYSRPEVCRDV